MLSVAKISSRISVSATSSIVPSQLAPIIIPFSLKKKILLQSRPEKFDCDGLYGRLPKSGVMETRSTTLGFGPGNVWQHRKHASFATISASNINKYLLRLPVTMW